jgi:hypothetical protein
VDKQRVAKEREQQALAAQAQKEGKFRELLLKKDRLLRALRDAIKQLGVLFCFHRMVIQIISMFSFLLG